LKVFLRENIPSVPGKLVLVNLQRIAQKRNLDGGKRLLDVAQRVSLAFELNRTSAHNQADAFSLTAHESHGTAFFGLSFGLQFIRLAVHLPLLHEQFGAENIGLPVNHSCYAVFLFLHMKSGAFGSSQMFSLVDDLFPQRMGGLLQKAGGQTPQLVFLTRCDTGKVPFCPLKIKC
jgi:hypothetical protein